jgi:mannose-1-phosphate guanylyltransferase
MLYAIIMAGGSGTRFWPASRASLPKQLLDLVGGKTMMQATVERLAGLVPPERVMVVTNQRLVEPIRQQLPELPAASVIGEPCKRDTAPCVGLAAAALGKMDEDATLLILPADHVIQPTQKFQDSLAYAVELVNANPERIVTFGIRPNYPAESFGYIERGAVVDSGPVEGMNAFRVERFREKPNQQTAEEYLATGRFYWNSGIFVWKAKTILAALEKYEPVMTAHLKTIGQAWGTGDFATVFEREFTAIKGKSIDYAVLEHYPNVVVVEAPYHWDDCGSWRSVARIRGEDEAGNTISGKHLGIRTTGSIVRSSADHLVVTLGMKDCIVVHTPDATLVANKHDEEAIREVVKKLEELGWKDYL